MIKPSLNEVLPAYTALEREFEAVKSVYDRLAIVVGCDVEHSIAKIKAALKAYMYVDWDMPNELSTFFECAAIGRQAKIASLTSELKDLLGVDIPKPTASTTSNESSHRQGSPQLPDPQFGEGLNS